MPQPDRAAAVGRLRVADGVDQVCLNRALGVDSGPLNIGAAPQLRIMPIELSFSSLADKDCARQLIQIVWARPFKCISDGHYA
jgi:hypothetical protein